MTQYYYTPPYSVTSRTARWLEVPGKPLIREVIELREVEDLTRAQRIVRKVQRILGRVLSIKTKSRQHISVTRWNALGELVYSATLWYLTSDEKEVVREDYAELSAVTDFDLDKLRFDEKILLPIGNMVAKGPAEVA